MPLIFLNAPAIKRLAFNVPKQIIWKPQTAGAQKWNEFLTSKHTPSKLSKIFFLQQRDSIIDGERIYSRRLYYYEVGF